MLRLETGSSYWSKESRDFVGKTSFGVVGDIVGAGKSYAILSTIKTMPCLKTPGRMMHRTAHYGTKFLEVKRVTNELTEAINVIVVPHGGVFSQWEGYIAATMMDDFHFIGISRKVDLENFQESPPLNRPQLILISNTFYNAFASSWPSSKRVSRVIFDEADSIRLPKCQEIESSFTWFITSSANNLMIPNGNSAHEGVGHQGFIKNVFRSIEDVRDRSFIFLKCLDSFIQSSLNLPEVVSCNWVCKSAPGIGLLHTICASDVSEMLHAGDVTGAIAKLGCSTAQSETTLFDAVTKNIQSRLNERQARVTYITSICLNQEEAAIRAKPLLEQIERYHTQIGSIRDRIANLNDEQCPICHEIAGTGGTLAAMKCCAQLFCLNCLQQCYITYNKRKCVMCRTPFTLSDVIAINSINTQAPQHVDFLSKIEQTILIIKNNREGRFLIFSAYEQTFLNLTDRLLEDGVKYDKLAGNSNQIKCTLRKFTSNETQVLFLNANFFGQGYNLQQTTDVIIFHKMSDELTAQVIGRAQRHGRTAPLNVHHLLHPGE
jgi:hypothetical protein